MAIRKRWDIPETEKRKTVDRLIYLRDNGEKHSVQLAAANAIRDMESQNQKDEHKFVDVRLATEHNRLASIAADLGVEADLIADVEAKSGGSIKGPTEASRADSDANAIEQPAGVEPEGEQETT